MVDDNWTIAAHHGPVLGGEKTPLVASVLLRSFGDTFGVAKVYGDRIEVWRNGNFHGLASTLDVAHNCVRKACNRELAKRG